MVISLYSTSVIIFFTDKYNFSVRSSTIQNSSSTQSFDTSGYQSGRENFGPDYEGGYQNFKDQKDAFFSKKQFENQSRPDDLV